MKKSYLFLICAIISLFSACSPHTNDDTINYPVTNSVLCAADIPGLKIIETESFMVQSRFRPDIDLKLQRLKQLIKIQDINVHLQYAEFPSTNIAQQASFYHFPYNLPQGVSVFEKNPFDDGIWEDAIHKTIGDQIWHYEYKGSIELLILSATTLVRISCDGGDIKTQKKLCEQLALKIVEKIKQGGKVLIPDEQPPP